MSASIYLHAGNESLTATSGKHDTPTPKPDATYLSINFGADNVVLMGLSRDDLSALAHAVRVALAERYSHTDAEPDVAALPVLEPVTDDEVERYCLHCRRTLLGKQHGTNWRCGKCGITRASDSVLTPARDGK